MHFYLQVTPQIDQLILIDRSVDLITPLATQLTYDGLIDQFFTINNCKLPSVHLTVSAFMSSPRIVNHLIVFNINGEITLIITHIIFIYV